MGGYHKTVREKRELDRKINLYMKECRSHVNTINLEKETVHNGLLDVQSKTKPLNLTVRSITQSLKEEKKTAQEELERLNTAKSMVARNGRPRMFKAVSKSVDEAKKKEMIRRERELTQTIETTNTKLAWITGEPPTPQVDNSKPANSQITEVEKKTMGVVNVMAGNKGFKGLLTQIRAKKQSELPRVKTPKADFSQVKDIGGLIDEFHKLPKVYDEKPKMKKPEKTKIFTEQYEERQKKRLLAMNYGTKTRIKRAQFHCDSLASVYLPRISGVRRPRCVTSHAVHSSTTFPSITRAVSY